jgi:hypothetical protein
VAVGVPRHPVHVTVRAGCEKFLQARSGGWNRIRPREADCIEALRARSVGDFALERGCSRRRQKSRLA